MEQRKKLEGNGMWESSRMMLPEHKHALNAWSLKSKERCRIELDDQELEIIGRRLTESHQLRTLVTVKMYHPTEELQIVGMVDRIDQRQGRFMVNGDWFMLRDIEGVVDVD
ncbi:YolD-like family protein [Paenibacillus sp. LHD-117]|uniref:YolD-like family protein n=1 Tax=Paenibacillus sp. LHD-117 TaxID=3071412 RepID=UPI0027E1A51F|nr:YolD-like family protein [Paenibacillus sp. LHD-117]MDQ6418662.1 YolD-like family protein [Paenibacillus sp. LHD-117]